MDLDFRPDEILPFARLPLQQSPAYAETLRRLGAAVCRVTARSGGAPQGQALVVARGRWPLRLAFVGRGPLWLAPAAGPDRDATFLRALARGTGLLVATPEAPVPARGLIPLAAARHHMLLQLAADPAPMRAALGQKWRNRLVRAEAAGLMLHRHRPGADPGWLLAADRRSQRLKGYRALPAAFTQAWQAADPAALRIYSAHRHGTCIAAAAFLLHRPWATYHIAWSDAAARGSDAPRLLLWRAMTDLGAEGYTMLDLGIEGPPGLAAFKRGTGAAAQALGPTAFILPSGFPRPAGSPGAWRAALPRAGGT